MIVWEKMLEGMASAAWIVGFTVVLGTLVALLYLFCVVMRYAFADDDGEEGTRDGAAEVYDEGTGGGVHAPTVGRHLYRGPGGDD